MIRQTLAGLTAIIASVSAIQADSMVQADATAQWHYGGGYGGYNPWAQSSSYYGSYGIDSKIQRLQRDVSYLVKQNSALKTRLIAAEAAITALQNAHGDGDNSDSDGSHISDLEDRVTALEAKAASNMMLIADNDKEIDELDKRVT